MSNSHMWLNMFLFHCIHFSKGKYLLFTYLGCQGILSGLISYCSCSYIWTCTLHGDDSKLLQHERQVGHTLNLIKHEEKTICDKRLEKMRKLIEMYTGRRLLKHLNGFFLVFYLISMDTVFFQMSYKCLRYGNLCMFIHFYPSPMQFR